MKYIRLLISPIILSLLPLSGCSQRNAKIYLYDDDSRFVLNSFDEQGAISLPTYRYEKTGEVPYVELGQFFYASGGLSNVRCEVKKIENGYQVVRNGGAILLTINPEKDTFVVDNYEYWSDLYKRNNDVGPDLASPQDEDIAAVHTSKSTKIHGKHEAEVYSLSKYNIDIVEQDEKCYCPVQFIANFYYRDLGMDILYNGMDYYIGSVVSNALIPSVVQSYFATDKRFMVSSNAEATSYAPAKDESYRFAYQVKVKDVTKYRIISLTNDGKGSLLEADSPTDAGSKAIVNDATISYNWQKKGDALYAESLATGKNPETGEEKTVSQGTSKIPLRKTFYATKKRPSSIIKFTYDLLRFQFDNFYGLKDVAKINDFDSYAKTNGLKNRLLSENPNTYDDALAELMVGKIDDGHTGYNLPSIFSGKLMSKANELSQKYEGNRRKSLFAKQETYATLRAQTMGITEDMDQTLAQGYFTSGSTAVIRFDAFRALGSFIPNTVEPTDIEGSDVSACFKNGDIPLGFDVAFNKIKKDTAIKNVVIDLTCNGGGQVSTIPYIAAHFSDDPTIYINDINMGVVKELHYKVDLNHDKKWGDEGDTYKGQYNFFILTSDFSFSCANFLPTVAKFSGVKVIGKQSGGGACSVGAFSDGSGSFYNFSSPQLCVRPVDNAFAHTDAGVPVDYELDSSSWYDLAKLDQFVSNIK